MGAQVARDYLLFSVARELAPKMAAERIFLFSSESVNEGHPDKLCDQVSDAVLDTCLTGDPKSKVACETATKEDLDVGAGDQGIMFGYASDETADCMPLTHSFATKLGKKLTDVRKSGDLWWLRPDGKTQVTIQYLQKADGSVQPLKIHTVVISTQHAEPSKATRSKECAGYSGPEMTAPSMEEMNKAIEQKVIKATLKEI